MVKMVCWLFLISGAIAAAIRLAGEVSGNTFLSETVPIKALNALVAGAILLMLLVVKFKKSTNYYVYIFAFLILTTILTWHLFVSPPAAEDAWNTIPFEFVRSLSLGAYLIPIFSLRQEQLLPKKGIVWIAIISGLVMVIFSLLQDVGLLPNLYYQWYGGRRLPRPTGGLEHPHFFSLILVLSSAIIVIGRRKRLIGKWSAIFIHATLLVGIFVSTSRVGLIAALMFWSSYFALSIRARQAAVLLPIMLLFSFLASFFAVAFWDVIAGNIAGSESIDVFLSAFVESFGSEGDGSFLRGRDTRWAHEIELITATPLTFLFGYGHQPYVSHNLILRQLQSSGVIGTIAYLTMLFTVISYGWRFTSREFRSTILATVFAFTVSAMTFPVLVSVPVLCGMVMLMAFAISADPLGHSRAKFTSQNGYSQRSLV